MKAVHAIFYFGFKWAEAMGRIFCFLKVQNALKPASFSYAEDLLPAQTGPTEHRSELTPIYRDGPSHFSGAAPIFHWCMQDEESRFAKSQHWCQCSEPSGCLQTQTHILFHSLIHAHLLFIFCGLFSPVLLLAVTSQHTKAIAT